MCCIGSESGCSAALGSSLFGSIASTSLTNEPLPIDYGCYLHYPTRIGRMLFDPHGLRFEARGDSCFAAHHARRISLPDMDGSVAAIWTPAAECLFQRRMRNHGFVFAQGLAQNQIAFRPMVVTGGGSHQNITGCPLPYSFQRQQTILDICLCQTVIAIFRKKSSQRFHGFHSTSWNPESAKIGLCYLFSARKEPGQFIQTRSSSAHQTAHHRCRGGHGNLLAQDRAHGNLQS